jgi:hypothetical protein
VRALDDVVNDMHATIHAVIVWVAKAKYGGRFDGEVTDGCRLMRIVVFDERQQELLKKIGRACCCIKEL